VAGFVGAIAATIAMFFSAFVNILIILPLIEKRFANSPKLKDFTHWAFPAVIGGIVATTFKLAALSLVSPSLWVLLGITTFIVFWKHPPAWLVIPVAGILFFAVTRVMQI
jgi:chromate transport protein ChrA